VGRRLLTQAFAQSSLIHQRVLLRQQQMAVGCPL